MKRMEFEIGGKLYRRVSRPTARKAYDRGAIIMICPCKLRPGKPWYPETLTCKVHTGRDFDPVARDFEIYNCNAESGWYASFYLEVKEKPGD